MSEEVEKAWEEMKNAHWSVIVKNLIMIIKSLETSAKLTDELLCISIERIKVLEDRVKD